MSSALLAADYALVVGVDECPEFQVNGVRAQRLAGAERDADAFAALLRDRFNFSQVSVLKGEQAKFAAIESQFVGFRERVASGDQFVFYFAGHGTQVPDGPPYDIPYDEQDDDKIDEALCASDAWVGPNMFGHNLVVDDLLKKWLKDFRAKRVTIVLDCCHAGTGAKAQAGQIIERWAPSLVPANVVAKSSSRPWGQLQSIRKGNAADGVRTVVAFYACSADQKALERRFEELPKPNNMRGQFTALLIENLKKNPQASLGTIAKELTDEIQAWEKANRREKRPQRPAFEPQEAHSQALILGS